MDEKAIEARFVHKARGAGALAIKFISPGNAGVPDRVIFAPNGRVYFAEIKAPGKKPSKLQEKWKAKIESYTGGEVWIIDSYEDIDDFIQALGSVQK